MHMFGLLKKASWILVISFILTISPLLTLSHQVSGNGVTITTLPATNITTNSATLNGSVSQTSFVRFSYGLTAACGTIIDVGVPGNDFSANISGLSPGTTYHFRAEVLDFEDWIYDNQMTFTTAGTTAPSSGLGFFQPPKVVTIGAGNVTDISVTVSGNLTDMGSANRVEVFFRYGTTESAVILDSPSPGDNYTAARVLTATATFNADISGLSPGTLYYFRAVAMGDGTASGAVMTFTTGHKMQINMTGQTNSVASSNGGQLLEPLSVTSGDGVFELQILEGTIALDKDGNPLQSITINVATELPNPPPGANIIGFIYNCEPAGATFEPPLILTMHYDPDALPDGVTEESLTIAYWNGSEWLFLEGTVDTENHTVSVSISHFSGFALMCELPATPPQSAGSSTSSPSTAPGEEKPSPAPAQPAVTQTPPAITQTPPAVTPAVPAAPPAPPAIPPATVPPEQKAFNWWWLVAIVIGVAIIGWIAFRFVRRRN